MLDEYEAVDGLPNFYGTGGIDDFDDGLIIVSPSQQTMIKQESKLPGGMQTSETTVHHHGPHHSSKKTRVTKHGNNPSVAQSTETEVIPY